MGQRAQECWSDAWPVVGGLLNDVSRHGKAFLFTEMLVPIMREGRLQDAWWNYSYSPTFDDAGAVAGVLVVATETTAAVAARKQLEAAKIEAELARRELQGVFMQAPLPMALLKGPEHRFAFVNEPYRALVCRDVQGKALSEAFSDVEVGYYRPVLDRVYETGESVVLREAPLRLPGSDGSVGDRFIDVGYHAYRDPDGAVAGVIAVIHDVTANVVARARESALRKGAEAASLAKDEFLATVSHELRTPLNAILGWSRILIDKPEPQKVEKGPACRGGPPRALAVIERNANAQAKLIEDILDVSRVVAGKLVIDLQRVQLSSVVQTAVESIRPAAAAKRIQIGLTIDDGSVEFIADEDRLQQVVWNLLANAVKFTPPGGEVRVVARKSLSSVLIRVEDTGKGIEAEFLPHVFERFRQGDASTTKAFPDLGLGLAIVRHLVELHGGTVEARSEGTGRGATFEVRLPIRAVEPRAAASVSERQKALASERHGRSEDLLRGIRALVVDDEDDARDILATVLEEAGASVASVSSVAEALSILASSPVDVIVSDIGMAGEDGYSLLHRVRADDSPVTRGIPALALTAYARLEDRRRAIAAGFQEHLAKPADAGALVKAVASLTRGRSPGSLRP